MKAQLTEYEGCFSIELQAETIQEAATITRFGLNRTKEIRSTYAHAGKTGEFTAAAVLGKSKKADGRTPRKT